MKNTAKAKGTPAAAWFYGPQGFGSTVGNVPTPARCEVTDEAISDGGRAVRRCRLADGHDGKHIWASWATE